MNRLAKIIIKNWLHIPKVIYHLYHNAKFKSSIAFEDLRKPFQVILAYTKKDGEVSIEVSGLENLPTECGYILYPNHQGIFDGFALLEAIHIPFSPVIKEELMHYPVVKQIFSCLDAIPMNRNDLRQSMEAMHEVENRVMNNEVCLIFPEGTRNRSNSLIEFKYGCFKPAIKTRCPIVPVALINSFQPFDKDVKGNIVVQVHILEPLYYDEYVGLKSKEIAALVKLRIENYMLSHYVQE